MRLRKERNEGMGFEEVWVPGERESGEQQSHMLLVGFEDKALVFSQ
jgi:hypothetical protein